MKIITNERKKKIIIVYGCGAFIVNKRIINKFMEKENRKIKFWEEGKSFVNTEYK